MAERGKSDRVAGIFQNAVSTWLNKSRSRYCSPPSTIHDLGARPLLEHVRTQQCAPVPAGVELHVIATLLIHMPAQKSKHEGQVVVAFEGLSTVTCPLEDRELNPVLAKLAA